MRVPKMIKATEREWRVTPETGEQFRLISNELSLAEPFSPQYHDLIDQIKSLPGYPVEYNFAGNEILSVNIVDKITSVVH